MSLVMLVVMMVFLQCVGHATRRQSWVTDRAAESSQLWVTLGVWVPLVSLVCVYMSMCVRVIIIFDDTDGRHSIVCICLCVFVYFTCATHYLFMQGTVCSSQTGGVVICVCLCILGLSISLPYISPHLSPRGSHTCIIHTIKLTIRFDGFAGETGQGWPSSGRNCQNMAS